MKKIFTLISSAALFAAVSCQSTNISKPSSPISSVIKADLKADIAIGAEISGSSSASVLFNVFKFGADSKFADGVNYSVNGGSVSLLGVSTVDQVKAAAAYNACHENNADILVAPRYIVEIDDFFVFKTINVTVTAKKGTITNITNMK